MKRNKIGQTAAVFFIVLLTGCSPKATTSNTCETGYDNASKGDFQAAIPLLVSCLDSKDIGAESRRRAFLARAWSYSNLKNPAAAVADQEAAFQVSRGCKRFCVNGHLAGNCLTLRGSEHDRSKESTIAGFD